MNIQTKELRPYEVSEKNINRLTEEACNLFIVYGHFYKREAVRKLIKTAIERKSKELIPLLQNVEGWDPVNLHVHLVEELDLKKDSSVVRNFFRNMKNGWGNKERILVQASADGHNYEEWKARLVNLTAIRDFFCQHLNNSGDNPFTSIINENNYTDTTFGGYTYDDIVREILKCREAIDGMPGEYTQESYDRWTQFVVLCNKFANMYYERISKTDADYVNRYCPTIRAREGQPTTRIVRKFFDLFPEVKEMTENVLVPNRDENGEIIRDSDGSVTGFHYEKVKTFNKHMVEYCESIAQTKVKRHFIVSVNPIDYLTMSFGNSWASCQTIDIHNIRKKGDHYHGMYCGGTLSYMLDEVTAVCYTVDGKYDGNSFELQDKIDRNLIHYHDGIFIQGRLYPQSNDGSSGSNLYKQFREIEERVISEGLGAPNNWNYRNGTDANRFYYENGEGAVHYKDYACYETTGVCRIKVGEGKFRDSVGDPNPPYERMIIGSCGIDIYTGAPISINGALTAVTERNGRRVVWNAGSGNVYIDVDTAVYSEEMGGYLPLVRASQAA